MPKAYSYIRFSSVKQEEGHSLTRQQEAAEKYARENGLEIDTHSYRDLGISAFRGKNSKEGKLGLFLKAVDDGLIPNDSILFVESLDRLSRASIMDALPLFMGIINRGITIVTVADSTPQVYTREKINADNGMSLFGSMMILLRAHSESDRKSGMVKKAWADKWARKEPTKNCPPWLQVNAAGTAYIQVAPVVKIVRKVFDLAMAGNGLYLIYKHLNEHKVPQLGNAKDGWTVQSVGRLIHNQAVIGRLVSIKNNSVIEDYYPSIIDKAVFYEVAEKLKVRHKTGRGRKGENIANLFGGLIVCGECGSRMRFMRVPSGGHHNEYLECLSAYHKKGCESKRVNYTPLEKSLLQYLLENRAINVIPASAANADPLIAIRAEVTEKEQQIEKLMDLIEASGERESKNLLGRLAKREEELEHLKRSLLTTTVPKASQDVWDEAQKAYDEHQELLATPGANLREARLKLQGVVRQFVEKVELPSAIREYTRGKTTVRRRDALVTFRGNWGAILTERDIKEKYSGSLGPHTEEAIQAVMNKPRRVPYLVPNMGNQGNVGRRARTKAAPEEAAG